MHMHMRMHMHTHRDTQTHMHTPFKKTLLINDAYLKICYLSIKYHSKTLFQPVSISSYTECHKVGQKTALYSQRNI
jgi:hypothetical protein